MNRLFRVVIASIVLSVLLCGAVVVIGRAQPADVPLPELAQCGATMCVYGIKPNATVWKDAQAILRRTNDFSFSIPGDNNLFKQSYPFYRLDLFEAGSETTEEVDTAHVSEVDFYFYDFFKYPGPTAAELLARFGTPCAVSSTTPGHLNIVYPGMSMFFIEPATQITDQRLELGLRLIELNVFDKISPCDPRTANRPLRPWRGFADYQN